MGAEPAARRESPRAQSRWAPSVWAHWRPRLFDPLAWWLSRSELHDRIAACGDDLEKIVDATELYQGRGFYSRIHAVQNRREILGLAERVRRLAPRIVVEIGTFKGGTLFIWCRAAQPQRVFSIDLPGGLYGGGYEGRREKLYREFLVGRPEAEMVLLRDDSHHPRTFAALEAQLGGAAVDFLYIDGDHSYEGVKADFLTYGPLVRPGGLIAFHDIITRQDGHEVHRLWPEIRESYRYEELIDNPAGNKGLGLLWV